MDDGGTRTVGLRSIVDALRDHAAVVRVTDDDLIVVLANEVMAGALGHDPSRLAGTPLGELQPASAVDIGRRLAVGALGEGRTQHRELELEARGGHRVLDVTVIPLDDATDEVLIITRDLTGVRRTADALAETQAIARVGHWSWDVQADSITWTDELYRVFGVDPETWEATYDSYVALIHPEDRAAVQERISTAVADATRYTIQHRIVRPDGSVRVISSNGDVVTGHDGVALRLAGTAQDITERIEAQEEAMRLREAHARHEQGLELNDNVMQGLAISRLALMAGDHDRALGALDAAMEAVRTIIRSLVEARVAGAEGLRAGDLVRTRGALEDRS